MNNDFLTDWILLGIPDNITFSKFLHGYVFYGLRAMLLLILLALQNVHTSMTEVYGVPVWGSYTIFAVATIVVGLILGVVCCIL